MGRTVADYLVDLMIDVGVRNIYGIVGDSANPVVDAIRKAEGRINFVHVRNEEAGAFAAGADALASGRPAAVLGSSGPGSLHLLNGLYDCNRNGAPVFAIATHIPSLEIGTRYFQETKPELIFADCARYVGTITSPNQMPRIAELALQAAILQRGVGVVILPGDVGAAEVEKPLLPHAIAKDLPIVRPPDGELDAVAEAINGARRIAIYGGDGCRAARAEVLKLAEVLQAPVGYSFRGKDILEADNPNAVGMTGLLGWGGAHMALSECDLLLMLGTDFPYHHFLPADATIVQVDSQPGHLGRRARVTYGLVGDVGETLRVLLPRLVQRSDAEFLERVMHAHGTAVRDLETYTDKPGSGKGLRPERVATAISSAAAADAIFTVDTGMCNVWAARYLHMKPEQRILASFSHGSMANAMPQAIGAKLGAPERQVIALCGDGGFAMLMGELLTIANWNIPVKLMIFNNSTLGMVRAEMQVAGYPPFGTDVVNPDFGALARVVGIHGERVEQAEDIEVAIQRALATDGPALVDFVTDARALAMPPHVEAGQIKGFALAATKLTFSGDVSEVKEAIRSNIRNVREAVDSL